MPNSFMPKIDRLMVKDSEGNSLLFDFEKLNKMKKVTSAIQNSTRLSIINHLSLMGEQRVSQIYQTLGIVQAICSQHLLILREAEVVQTRREGHFVYYSISPKIKWITMVDPEALMLA